MEAHTLSLTQLEHKFQSSFLAVQVARAVIPQATEKRPERQFGFVHYAEQSSADKAVEEAGSDKPELLGNTLEVGLCLASTLLVY